MNLERIKYLISYEIKSTACGVGNLGIIVIAAKCAFYTMSQHPSAI